MTKSVVIASVVAMGCLAITMAAEISRAPSTSSAADGPNVVGQVSEHGDLYRYAVYVPSSRPKDVPVPLVVALHGCGESASQLAGASGLDQLAARRGLIALYPDGDAVDQVDSGCWKGLWKPSAEGRGRGDAGAIAAMTLAAIAHWRVDRSRVYVIGMSAGGFEAAILGADYPDLYAAIGIHSGAAYAGGGPGCSLVSERPVKETTNSLAHAALNAMGDRARVMPVIVIHGDKDGQVPYRCGRQALAQWLLTDDLVLRRHDRRALIATPSRISRSTASGAHAYTVASFITAAGCVVAQLWTVHGMGHFWSGGGTATRSSYSDPRGPSATAAAWDFFSRWTLHGPAQQCTSRTR